MRTPSEELPAFRLSQLTVLLTLLLILLGLVVFVILTIKQSGVREDEEEDQEPRNDSPVVQEGDDEGKGDCAGEDVADEERAKLSHQLDAVACFEDTVGLIDLC